MPSCFRNCSSGGAVPPPWDCGETQSDQLSSSNHRTSTTWTSKRLSHSTVSCRRTSPDSNFRVSTRLGGRGCRHSCCAWNHQVITSLAFLLLFFLSNLHMPIPHGGGDALSSLSLLSSSPFLLGAEGWSKAVHEAIGMTTMSAINGHDLAQLRRLTNGKDVADIAGWAIQVAKKHPKAEVLHFHLNEGTACNGMGKPTNPEGQSLLNAIRHFYGRLTGVELETMTYPDDMKLTDADAVMYLINLLGDLHQPLHVGFTSDNGGRDFKGKFASYKGDVETNLYEVWDRLQMENVMETQPGFWNSGWTHVNAVKEIYEKEKKEFQESKHLMFEKWANSTQRLLCEMVYSHPTRHTQLEQPFEVDRYLGMLWFDAMRKQVLIAGARTAIVLNSILESRDISALRVGSGVGDVAVDTDVISKPRTPVWIRNLLINLMIVVVVLGVLAYVTKFYSIRPAATIHSRKTEVNAPALGREMEAKHS